MMAALPYMQFYVADYLADTTHLTAEEHGAYMLLLFSYWQLRRAPLEAIRAWERRGLPCLAVAGLLFLYLIAPLCFGAEGTAIAWALALGR